MARERSLNVRAIGASLLLVGALSIGLDALVAAVSSPRAPITTSRPPFVGTGPAAPAPGPSLAVLGSIGPRDEELADRTRSLDPASARETIATLLRARGYVGDAVESDVRAMPFDVVPAELHMHCGLVVVLGEAGAVISDGYIEAARETLEAIDPRVFTFAACGTLPVHIDGSGGAVTRVWIHPGIDDIGSLGGSPLSADGLLAHEEAEGLLRAHGFEPHSEIVTMNLLPDAGGSITLAPPHVPASGCTPFVAYVRGAGPAGSRPTQWARAFSTLIGCRAGTPRSLALVDDARPGARAFVRAYGAGDPSSLITVETAFGRDVATATWPPPIVP